MEARAKGGCHAPPEKVAIYIETKKLVRSLAGCNLARTVDQRKLPARWEGGATLGTTVSIHFWM